MPEGRAAERNCERSGRSKSVPNCQQETQRRARNVPLQLPIVLPEPCVAANESCTSYVHTPPHERRRMSQIWKLVGPDGKPYTSAVPGTLGGHRSTRIYGRLGCPAALRVFILTEEHAWAAGYRPCAVCLPMAYARWKSRQDDGSGSRPVHEGRLG